MNYYTWLRGGGCCQPMNNCGCGGKDVCDCQEILLEISKLHTDDEILQDEIDDLSGKVDTKLDASAYTPVDLTDYYTKEESDEKFLTEHQPLKTINGNVISGTGDIIIEASGGSVTVDDHLDSTSTNPVQNKVITGALNGKLDASAYTPTDLSNYYTKEEVNSAITAVENEIPSLSGYATEQWVLDKNYITGVDLSNYATLQDIPVVPTSNSAFTNDMHYVTSAETANYVTSGNVETQIVNHFWCGNSTQWSQISGNTQPDVLYLIYE